MSPSPGRLVIGSRGSRLALIQAEWVRDRLREAHTGLEVAIAEISTKGDRILDAPLAKIGDKGLFTKELETALLEGRIDVAVHSAKDMPTELPDGLSLGAFTEREDVHDAFVGGGGSGGAGSLADLAPQARIGSSSLRRRSQLLALRPDLELSDIRGNVETRLRKIGEQGLAGTVLAVAGLRRLGRPDIVSFVFGFDEMLPAVGQGALAVEVRGRDERVAALVAPLDHRPTALAVRAERALMHRLEGGCQVPIGAHGELADGELHLRAFVGSLDGRLCVRDAASGRCGRPRGAGGRAGLASARAGRRPHPRGRARRRRGASAADHVSAGRVEEPLSGLTVVVTRAEAQAAALARPLEALGARVLLAPMIRITPTPLNDEIRAAVARLADYDLAVFTSVNAVSGFLDRVGECGADGALLRRATIVAIGPKTAAALAARGLPPDIVPAEAVAESAVEALAAAGTRLDGALVLFPRAREAREVIPEALHAAGASVDVVTVYETVGAEALAVPAAEVEAADFIAFTASSTAEHFVHLMGPDGLARRLAGVRLCSIGPVTSETLRRHGLTVAVEADPHTVEGLVNAIRAAAREKA